MPQLEIDSENFIYQQDGAPPHFHRDVREFLNMRLTNRWIGRDGEDDQKLMSWPICSPDLTPCDFFVWRYVKQSAFVPPLPVGLPELRARIINVFQQINWDMLHRVWDEFDYRLDLYAESPEGEHMEYL